MNIMHIVADDATDDELAEIGCRLIVSATYAYDETGDVAGIVYRDDATGSYYVATIGDLRSLVETYRATGGRDSYLIRRSNTASDAFATSDEALAPEGMTA